jgi:hypothetical protein
MIIVPLFIFAFCYLIEFVLIPYLRIACQLNNLNHILLPCILYCYLVMATVCLDLKHTGFKKNVFLFKYGQAH